MTNYVAETYEEVRELLQRGSWEILDEEQRDNLMKNVIVPRWGKVTADGVVLKATAWAKALGTTVKTIEGRYSRLCRSETQDSPPHRGPTPNQKSAIRTAKSAIRQHPELAAELAKDHEIVRATAKALAETASGRDHMETELARHEPRSTPKSSSREPDALDLIGDLRTTHRIIDRVATAITSGAVVNDEMADALIVEVDWLSNALDVIRASISGDSFEAGVARLIEEESR